ncbi:MAG: PilZ domain-containing protein [Candidatus Acidiferrales bacterium]
MAAFTTGNRKPVLAPVINLPETSIIARPHRVEKPRQFVHVPTHAIGLARERRRSPRAQLALPMRLVRVAQYVEAVPVSLVTCNISTGGMFFLAPRDIELGAAIELEVALVERSLGHGNVRMSTAAHIVRREECEISGWYGYAVTFDEFDFRRDDIIPLRFALP